MALSVIVITRNEAKRRKLPTAPVLCSDTTVARGRTIYGKPENDADARRMLRELAGRSHRVLTAVANANGRRRLEALSDSRVTFALSAARIAYVAAAIRWARPAPMRCTAGPRPSSQRSATELKICPAKKKL